MPDDEAEHCHSWWCRKKFGIARRKHHCRHCGNLYCAGGLRPCPLAHRRAAPISTARADCTAYTAIVPEPLLPTGPDKQSDPAPVRVCKRCTEYLAGSGTPLGRRAAPAPLFVNRRQWGGSSTAFDVTVGVNLAGKTALVTGGEHARAWEGARWPTASRRHERHRH